MDSRHIDSCVDVSLTVSLFPSSLCPPLPVFRVSAAVTLEEEESKCCRFQTERGTARRGRSPHRERSAQKCSFHLSGRFITSVFSQLFFSGICLVTIQTSFSHDQMEFDRGQELFCRPDPALESCAGSYCAAAPIQLHTQKCDMLCRRQKKDKKNCGN